MVVPLPNTHIHDERLKPRMKKHTVTSWHWPRTRHIFFGSGTTIRICIYIYNITQLDCHDDINTVVIHFFNMAQAAMKAHWLFLTKHHVLTVFGSAHDSGSRINSQKANTESMGLHRYVLATHALARALQCLSWRPWHAKSR